MQFLFTVLMVAPTVGRGLTNKDWLEEIDSDLYPSFLEASFSDDSSSEWEPASSVEEYSADSEQDSANVVSDSVARSSLRGAKEEILGNDEVDGGVAVTSPKIEEDEAVDPSSEEVVLPSTSEGALLPSADVTTEIIHGEDEVIEDYLLENGPFPEEGEWDISGYEMSFENDDLDVSLSELPPSLEDLEFVKDVDYVRNVLNTTLPNGHTFRDKSITFSEQEDGERSIHFLDHGKKSYQVVQYSNVSGVSQAGKVFSKEQFAVFKRVFLRALKNSTEVTVNFRISRYREYIVEIGVKCSSLSIERLPEYHLHLLANAIKFMMRRFNFVIGYVTFWVKLLQDGSFKKQAGIDEGGVTKSYFTQLFQSLVGKEEFFAKQANGQYMPRFEMDSYKQKVDFGTHKSTPQELYQDLGQLMFLALTMHQAKMDPKEPGAPEGFSLGGVFHKAFYQILREFDWHTIQKVKHGKGREAEWRKICENNKLELKASLSSKEEEACSQASLPEGGYPVSLLRKGRFEKKLFGILLASGIAQNGMSCLKAWDGLISQINAEERHTRGSFQRLSQKIKELNELVFYCENEKVNEAFDKLEANNFSQEEPLAECPVVKKKRVSLKLRKLLKKEKEVKLGSETVCQDAESYKRAYLRMRFDSHLHPVADIAYRMMKSLQRSNFIAASYKFQAKDWSTEEWMLALQGELDPQKIAAMIFAQTGGKSAANPTIERRLKIVKDWIVAPSTPLADIQAFLNFATAGETLLPGSKVYLNYSPLLPLPIKSHTCFNTIDLSGVKAFGKFTIPNEDMGEGWEQKWLAWFLENCKNGNGNLDWE